MTYSEASREAQKFVRAINDLEPGIEYSDRTMAQLITGWRHAVKPNLKRSTQESYEWAFKRIEDAFGATPLSEIERSAV